MGQKRQKALRLPRSVLETNLSVCKGKGRDADFALRTNLYVKKKEMQVLS